MTRAVYIFTIICLTSLNALAQTSFSCYHREYCKWNDYTEDFDECSGYDEPSLFVMNEDETMFTHTIESMKSTYYIDEQEYDSENEWWIYSVRSDVGNKYIYIFDPNNKAIKAITEKDGEMIAIVFFVKAIF